MRIVVAVVLLLVAAAGIFVLLGRPGPADELPRQSLAYEVPLAGGPSEGSVWLVVDAPRRMRMEHSSWITLSVHQDEGELPDVQTSTAAPVQAFWLEDGSDGDQVVAVAVLDATTFETKPGDVLDRTLGEAPLRWAWNLRPLHRGEQVINLAVDVEARGEDGAVDASRVLWQEQLPVYVEQPLIATGGQVSLIRLVSWVAAAVGTTLVLPLVSRFVSQHLFGKQE